LKQITPYDSTWFPPEGQIAGVKRLLLTTLIISLFFSCKVYQQTSYEYQQIRVIEDVSPDTSVEHIINPYKTELDKEMNEVIGEFGNEMSRAKPESSLGNFVCDMLLKEGQRVLGDTIDFAVYNYGGIRIDAVGSGPITRGKIFELLPFENFAVVVTLDAGATIQLIQKVIDEGGWPVGGVRIEIKNNKPEHIYIHNMPFDSTRIYKIIMNDYMANGGDNLFFLAGKKTDLLNVTIRDLAIHYIQNEYQSGKKVYSTVDGRITYAE